MIEITHEPIDSTKLLAAVQSPRAGAELLFVGTTREVTGDRHTATLVYECYEPMARREMEQLAQQAKQQWTLCGCAIVHRVGNVGISEASVMIAVSSPHRADAFAAGRWLIDSLKEKVPIWKQENWADGTSEWVHPGIES